MALLLTATPDDVVRYNDGVYVTITATGNVAAVDFAVISYPTGSSAGTLSVVSTTVNRWYPPNRVGTYVIEGDDGTTIDTITITVEAVLPILPNWDYEMNIDDNVKVSKSEDNYLMFRVKSGSIRSWNLPFPLRTVAEYELLRDFWEFHRKHKFFYWDDLGTEEGARLVHFSSGLKVNPKGPNALTITCVIEEVRVA